MNRIGYLKEKVRTYYKKKSPTPPPDFEKREFGAGDEKKIDYRHLAFKSKSEFQNFFIERAPLYASYSVAYYEFPDGRPMKNKHMQSSDLIFEFDAECEHDTLTCYECLDWTKQQTQKLIENFLVPDFGLSKKDILISFSGNRGYHIHIRSKDVQELGRKARREITDYLQMRNPNLTVLLDNAVLKSGGWKGKLSNSLFNFVKDADNETLKKFGFREPTVSRIINRKQEILSGIQQGNFDQIKNAPKIWKKIVTKQIGEMAADIDPSVTLDIARLIRLPTTIHSTTGFLDMYVDNLDNFDPFKDPIVFMNYPEKIKFKKDVSEFALHNSTLGPFKKDQIAEVPEFAAFFCIGKDVAETINK